MILARSRCGHYVVGVGGAKGFTLFIGQATIDDDPTPHLLWNRYAD